MFSLCFVLRLYSPAGLPPNPPCLVLNGYFQKVIASLQGWRFTTTGNPVTPQLTNPLEAKVFYNKVPLLKMRLTTYKSYTVQHPICAPWAKKPSQRASVCPCPVQSKEIDSTPNGKSGWGSLCPPPLPVGCPSPHPLRQRQSPAFTSHLQLQVPNILSTLTRIYIDLFITWLYFTGNSFAQKYLFRVRFSQWAYFNQQLER